MKVKALDKFETSHTMIAEFEPGKIKPQPGLAVLSEEASKAHGMTAVVYVILVAKDAVIDLPDRLAKRLIGIKLAKAVK